MKIRPNVKTIAAVAFAVSVTTVSCKKDSNPKTEDPQMQNAVAATADNNIASAQFNDVLNISLGVKESDAGEPIGIGTGAGVIYRPGGNEGTLGAQCFSVTVTPKVPGQWPKTATFDFGDGCKGTDGKVRRGKIMVAFSRPSYEPGATITTTFDGYNVDSFAISGTQVVQNTSADNKFAFSVTIADGKLTNTSSGFWHALAGKHTWTQSAGMGTPLDIMDDAYDVTGSVTGGNASGLTWKCDITKPLLRKINCKWRTKGEISVHWNQNPDAASLDYGDGSCDDKATLTYKGYSKVITLW